MPLMKTQNLGADCVESFKKYIDDPNVIPIALNGGQYTIEEAEELIKDYPGVELVTTGTEITKSIVFNMIIRTYDPEFICLIPPGTKEVSGDLVKLLDNFEDPKVFAVCPTVINTEDKILSVGTIFSRGLPKYADDNKPFGFKRTTEKREFKAVTTECSIFRCDTVRNIGGFKEFYMTGYEGLDACVRAHIQGSKCIHDPSLILKDAYGAGRFYEGKVIHDPDLEYFIFKNGGLEFFDKLNDAGEYYGSGTSMPSTERWTQSNGISKGKIVCFLADHFGCGQYRVKNPFRQLLKYGWDVMFTTFSPPEVLEWGDILIFQRQCADHMWEKIRDLRAKGKKVIYDIDDYFHGLEMHNPVTPEFINNPTWLRNIERIIYYSNALTVSTPELYKQYGKFNKNSYIIPNAIDMNMMPQPILENTDGTIRIGWGGSITHDADIQEVVEAIEYIVNKYDNTVMVFIGADYRKYFPNLPPNRMEWHPGTSDHEDGVGDYYKVINECRLDIGLAPVTNSHFNRCKSDLKAVEWAFFGLGIVASDVEPYAMFMKDKPEYGEKGLIAKNKKQWISHLENLITDKDLRYKLGYNAQQYAWKSRNTMITGKQINDICENLMISDGHVPKLPEPSISLPISFIHGKTSKVAEQLYLDYMKRIENEGIKKPKEIAV